MAYLGTVILDLAGLPLSDSHRERKRLMQLCKGRYYSCKAREEILRVPPPPDRIPASWPRADGAPGPRHGIAPVTPRVAHGWRGKAAADHRRLRSAAWKVARLPTIPTRCRRSRPRRQPSRSRRSLSVVVPVLNEERGLEPLVDRLRPVLDGLGLDWEVIFVDDGSTDGTLARAEGPQCPGSALQGDLAQPQLRQGDRQRRRPDAT